MHDPTEGVNFRAIRHYLDRDRGDIHVSKVYSNYSLRKIIGLQENEKSKYEILSSKVGIQDLHSTGYSIMISFGPKIMD